MSLKIGPQIKSNQITTSPLSSALTPPPPLAWMSPWLSFLLPSLASCPSSSPCTPAASQRSRRLTPLPLDSAGELSLVVVVVVEPELELLELPQLAGVAPCGSSVEKKQKKFTFTNNICGVNI